MTPPSLNEVGGLSHWRTWNKHKKEWQELIGVLLLKEVSPKRPLGTPVIMDAML
jgi:hypothetical protein